MPNQDPDWLIEQLAAIEHERWADWQKWCHQVIRENDAKGLSVENVLGRWDRQIATAYEKLTEKEKQSDRDQVMRYWDLITRHIQIEVLEARKKATLNFSGLWGIGGDGNDHVAIYRRIYGKEMEHIERELAELKNNRGGVDDLR